MLRAKQAACAGIIAAAVGGGLAVTTATPAHADGAQVAPSAYSAEWNCRIVRAQDTNWFLYSTGSTRTWPNVLRYGDRFRSYGVENGRFRGLTWTSSNHYWGWITADSRWSDQLPDSDCA